MKAIDASSPPTVRQAEVLEYIRGRYREKGIPPTMRMIVAMLGASSTNAGSYHLIALIRKGLIRRVTNGDGKAYYIPVVGEGCCPCCGRPG